MKKAPVSPRQSPATPAPRALLAEEAAHPPSLTSTNQPVEGSSSWSALHTLARIAIHASEQDSSISLPIQAKSPAAAVEIPDSTRASSRHPQRQPSRTPGGHSFASLAPTRSLVEATEGQYQQEQSREQLKSNLTGLPVSLKAGVEHLSGFSLDEVQVHHHSSKPAEVGALAYTQGTEIHVGPGQEQHLAHEAWHVVQQKQGRVTPTMQDMGVTINDDQALEQEADSMGLRASQQGQSIPLTQSIASDPENQSPVLQKYSLKPGSFEEKEIRREMKGKWGKEYESAEMQAFIAWCDTHAQSMIIVQKFSYQAYQELRASMYPAKDIGKSEKKIQEFLAELRVGSLGPRTTEQVYEERLRVGEVAQDILENLVTQNKVKRGNIERSFRSTYDTKEGQFSVSASIEGMASYVIHIHCEFDGQTREGNNAAHIKKRANEFGLGGNAIQKGTSALATLGHGREARLNHWLQQQQ